MTYSYDTCTDGKGKLCSATSSGAANLRPTIPRSHQQPKPKRSVAQTSATRYDYDRQGNHTLLTYPDNAQVRYTYNTAGLLDQVEKKESGGSFANVVDNIDYGPHGKPIFEDYANGTESIYTYDANELYRLTGVTTLKNLIQGSQVSTPDVPPSSMLPRPPEPLAQEWLGFSDASMPRSTDDASPSSTEPAEVPLVDRYS